MADKRVKREEAILLADQLKPCVILEKNTKSLPKEYLGKREIRLSKIFY